MLLTNKSNCRECGARITTLFKTTPANLRIETPIDCSGCGWKSRPGRGLPGIVLVRRQSS